MDAGGGSSGTLSFLFTDVEGSTRLWELHPAEMNAALAAHDRIVRSQVELAGGRVFSAAGDSFAAAFPSVVATCEAAVKIQEQLAEAAWPTPEPVRVRMGVHVGEAHERGGDYFGPTLNRAARIMSAAHGGQVVVSQAVRDMVADGLDAIELVDLGSCRLKDLTAAQQLFQLNWPGSQREFPPLRTLDAVLHNLPVEATPLVGRDLDVERIGGLVRSERVVSLVGVGGVGKTRLATAVAADLVHEFADGVWLCELAPVSDAGSVAPAVAEALNTAAVAGGSVSEAIGTFLRRREVLLVLDNCEHVLDAVGELVEVVTRVSPGTSVLVSSREPLGVASEHVVPVGSLPAETVSDPAVRLFVERASASAGWFDPAGDELDAVLEVCRRVDGIPLAVELAAARVRSMSAFEIRDRLSESFTWLRAGRRSVERHRTLDAAIDWSYRHLTPAEASAFEQLSVFAGGFTLASAQAVLGDARTSGGTSGDVGVDVADVDIADVIDELVLKSLVSVVERGLPTRYRMLEPLRQFAETQLAAHGDPTVVLDAHAAHFGELAATDPGAGLTELDNVRRAVEWQLTRRDVDGALRLLDATAWVLVMEARLEVAGWCERAATTPGAEHHRLGPQIAGWAAHGYFFRGEIDRASELVELARSMPAYSPASGQPAVVASTLTAFCDGDLDAALAWLEPVDVNDPRAFVAVNYYRANWGSGPAAELALAELDRVAAFVPEAARFASSARSYRALRSGDCSAILHDVGEFWDWAERSGNAWNRVLATNHRVAAALRCDRVEDDLITIVVAALQFAEERSYYSDQWYTIGHAARLLWHLGDRDTAPLLHAAYRAGPYSGAFEHLPPDPELDRLAARRSDDTGLPDLSDLGPIAIDALRRCADLAKGRRGV